MARSWCDAVLRALILLVPVLSVSDIDPVLSSTSDTHNRVWPHTAVEEEVMCRWGMPPTASRVVLTSWATVRFTDWPEMVGVPSTGCEPLDGSSL